MKKIIKELLLIIVIFIALTFVSVFFLMKSNTVLIGFNIKYVNNIYNTFELEFDEVKAAKYYKVELIDNEANLIYFFDTHDTYNRFIVDNLKYNTTYSFMVYAYDNANNYMPAKSSYEFVYEYPTFDKSNLILNNQEYKININGSLSNKDYYINISNEGKVLLNDHIKTNEYLIPLDLYKDKQIELSIQLLCDGVVVDNLSLFNDMNPIKDIYIETPVSNTSVLFNDVVLIFHGGENAEHYNINIYNDKTLINTSETTKKKIVLSRSLFESDKQYRIEVEGVYKDYKKTTDVTFDLVGLPKLKPVYINVNPKAIKKNTKLELKQPEGAKIYYTLNGDDPTTNGIPYEEPILITDSCVLKVTAKENLRSDAVVTTYNLNVSEQTQFKFYISPSNQGRNLGVQEVGFTTEKYEMNKVADYVIAKLKQYDNVKVYRNNPEGGINQWNRDANYLGVDLKFAIHSNASVDHTSYGIETWIDNELSDTYSIASLLQEKMVEMYPYKDRENYDRGVKYSLGNLGEANDNLVRFGLLIELAHHDDMLDAKWLKENQQEIGEALAEVILKYFQVI